MKQIILSVLVIGLVLAATMILNSQTPTAADFLTLQKQVAELTKTTTELKTQVALLQSAVQVTSSSVTIQSAAITLKGSASLNLKAPVIGLNGGQPVARIGDHVQVNPDSGSGTIITGSTTVTAN